MVAYCGGKRPLMTASVATRYRRMHMAVPATGAAEDFHHLVIAHAGRTIKRTIRDWPG